MKDINGLTIPAEPVSKIHNYSYFPVLIEHNYPLTRDDLYEELKIHGIFTRRYFYPLITDFPMYRGLKSADPSGLLQATKIAQKILCLPIYPDLSESDQQRIIEYIRMQ